MRANYPDPAENGRRAKKQQWFKRARQVSAPYGPQSITSLSDCLAQIFIDSWSALTIAVLNRLSRGNVPQHSCVL